MVRLIPLSFFVLFVFPLIVSSQTYTTIADGNWSSSSTWMSGSVPPHENASGVTINIFHDVIFDYSGVTLKIGETSAATVTINGGSFYSDGDDEIK